MVARIEVSVWLNLQAVIVSIVFGQERVCRGALLGLLRSYMLITLLAAAIAGSVLCFVMAVKAAGPKYVDSGAELDA